MKGYLLLDVTQGLQIRTCEYIETENPNFFGDNKEWVDSYWKFDSESPEFERVLDSLNRKELQEEEVRNFCTAIGFDLDAFLERKRIEKLRKA